MPHPLRNLLTAGLLLLGLGLPALAQFPVELICPPGTGPIFQARDNVTQGLKQWACVDNLGNVTIQPQAVNIPPLGTSTGATNITGFRATANNNQVINYFGSGVSNVGTQSSTLVYPGATTITAVCNTTFACQEMGNAEFTSGSTASTSTVVGSQCCANANSGSFPILSWNTLNIKAAFGTVATQANLRWWVGLSVFANASTLGINGTGTLATTAYAQDLPNKTTIAFRCNPASGANWKAVQIQANNSGAVSTVIDTGVVCDTGIHVFGLSLSQDSSTITWHIDGVQVATATSIINLSVANTNVLDVMSQIFFTGDNRNTATQVGMVFFWAIMQERLQ